MTMLWNVCRFEVAYQARRGSAWLCAAVLFALAAALTVAGQSSDTDEFVNSPFTIAFVTVVGNVAWLLIAASIAGDAAARDVQTRMHPLMYTAPVRKLDYLAGRFLAAFVLNAGVLLAVPAGILLALLVSDVDPARLGPFRPEAYLTAYGMLALPFAFVATAVQFCFATLARRPIASYLGSLLLFFTSHFAVLTAAQLLGRWELVTLLDVVGLGSVVTSLGDAWTAADKNTRLVGLDGTLIANRLIWLAIAACVLGATFLRFRLAHPAEIARRRFSWRRKAAAPSTAAVTPPPLAAPPLPPRTFGVATHARQARAIAWTSFRSVAAGRAGLVLVGLFALHLVLFMPEYMKVLTIPVLPTTGRILDAMTTSVGNVRSPLVLIPLLIAFYAGELIWRDRDAGMSDVADATPVPEWALFAGAFLGLGLVIAAWLTLLAAAGMLAQLVMGYHDLEPVLYLKILFGLQFPEYLLFATLALAVHAVVNQKVVGHLTVLLTLGFIAVAPRLGIEHHLLVYGSAPAWSYTDMRSFGNSLMPWLWFTLYWSAWALGLAVAAQLLWSRGRQDGLGTRLRLARGRVSRPTIWTASAAAVLVVSLGTVVFVNTNVRHRYRSTSDTARDAAEYERRYGQYEGTAQPLLSATALHVEIYPTRRAVEIRGTYRLVNRSEANIDSVHVATSPDVETGEVAFDRRAALVLADDALGHRIYALDAPLRPGDAVTLRFAVAYHGQGFRNDGADEVVVPNGTVFNNRDWLPAIGYQPNRELRSSRDRQEQGLDGPASLPGSLDDVDARAYMAGQESITVDAVVGTDAGQVAVAPGTLRRTWTDRGRHYVHYVTDAPVRNDYTLFSAAYATRDALWTDPSGRSSGPVTIQILHHPGHTANLDRMVRSIQASLTRFTAAFGPYPYRSLRFVERPGGEGGMTSQAGSVAYDEGFSDFNPRDPARGLDLPFYVVAHEVSHQWWGAGLAPATVEGGWLMTESLAVYSGMQVLRDAYGPDQLQWYLDFIQSVYDAPRTRAAAPLLRANTAFLGYRKGAVALHSLSQYVGEDRVNGALRHLLITHPSVSPPLPTSLDLYRELQAVTPDSLRPLLSDLFTTNTFWSVETTHATATRTRAGLWQVTLRVQARKVTVDGAGTETSVPMDDWVQIGVFAPVAADAVSEKPLYLQMHRIHSGEQTVTVMVPQEPARAGIDPNGLLIDLERLDNVVAVER